MLFDQLQYRGCGIVTFNQGVNFLKCGVNRFRKKIKQVPSNYLLYHNSHIHMISRTIPWPSQDMSRRRHGNTKINQQNRVNLLFTLNSNKHATLNSDRYKGFVTPLLSQSFLSVFCLVMTSSIVNSRYYYSVCEQTQVGKYLISFTGVNKHLGSVGNH